MRNRIIYSLLFLLLIGGGLELSRAQTAQAPKDVMDLSLEELMKVDVDSVYGASGYKQNVADAPASITIVTAEEIRRYGYRTLSDVLRHVPGIYITSDRLASHIGVRGIGPPGDYNSRILVLLDGHRINSNIDGGVGLDMNFPVDIDLVDRVEVIRGPNTSTYIAGALLGVINVVTVRPDDTHNLSVSGELAGNGTYKSRLTYNHRFRDGLAMVLSGSFFDSHGPESLYFKEFDSALTNNGIARDANGTRADQFFGKLSYHDFTLEGSYAFSRQNDPTASYGTIFNDPEERIGIAPAYLDLSYEHHFGSDWGYQARLFYDNTRYHGVYPLDESAYGGSSHVLNQDRNQGQDVGASFALSKRLAHGQTFVVGSEYRNNFQQDQWNYNAPPDDLILFLNSHESSALWGGYVQDEIAIRPNLVLDLGLSYDHYSTFGGTTNPRFAIIYKPFKTSTFKLLYGQSFRAPTAFENYYALPGGQAGNPDLKPETAKTTELVWEQAVRKSVSLVVSGYYYPVRGVIQAGTDPVSGEIVYLNKARIDLEGAEITLKKQSSSGITGGLSVSIEHARDLSGYPVSNSPHVLGQANLGIPIFRKKLFAGMDLQYVSKRKTLAGDFAKAYVIPNFTLYGPNALRHWEFSASIYNAFDQIYGDPASVAHRQDVIYQEGRNFRLKFTYHF